MGMQEIFQKRLAAVQERIAKACSKAGRDPAGVKLVAVTKSHGPERVQEAAAAGLTVFGESRVQEAAAKIPLCPGRLSWHLVGHLQSNKVKPAAKLFDMIHSVDSLKLLEALDLASGDAGKIMPVLVEVNVSGEGSKYGLAPDAVPAVIEGANRLSRVSILGLMTIPPFAEDPEKARPCFRRLRELRDRWSADLGVPLPELSMGMTHDFDIAIEEGATWIRVGTALFGERASRKEASDDSAQA